MNAKLIAELLRERAKLDMALAEAFEDDGEAPALPPNHPPRRKRRSRAARPRPANPDNITALGMREARKLIR